MTHHLLKWVHGFCKEINDDDPPPPQIPRIREKTQAPVYIGGGLPPIPARLVKRIENGQFVEMAELLPDHLSSFPTLTKIKQKAQKSNTRKYSISSSGYSALAFTLL